MRVYTSFFSNFQKIPKSYLCIGISRFLPKEFQTTEIANFLYTPGTILAPSAELLSDAKSGKIGNEEYTVRYYQELSQGIKRLGFSGANEYFARMISEFSKSEWEAIVFMCYEKPDEFCHRHLLAALMRKNGIDVQEYKSVCKTSREDLHSPALF